MATLKSQQTSKVLAAKGNALFSAIDEKDSLLVEKVLSSFSPEEKAVVLELEVSTNETPLLYAARLGIAPVVKTLLEHGANINALDDEGNNILHICAIHSNVEETLEVMFNFTNCESLMSATNLKKINPFQYCVHRYSGVYAVDLYITHANSEASLAALSLGTQNYPYFYGDDIIKQFEKIDAKIEHKIKTLREQKYLQTNIQAPLAPTDKNHKNTLKI